ncbi:MAG TPA: TetR/AcrR family transcriptional regulator [Desulfobacteraceae bacterium]|nr:TetR/AcrR family transcriptional regulator [Desulfobacteraceae bacterium]
MVGGNGKEQKLIAQKNAKQENFRTLDKSLRIQKIIDTATDLFRRKGYRSTSLDDVSRELGVTKAAIYHYVSSKEEILSIIYIQALQHIFRNTNEILNKDIPPNEKLRLLLSNHVKNIIIQPLSMMCVFFSEENQLPEKEFRKIQNEKNKYNRIVEEIIKEGISLGIFRKTDPKLQTFAILGMCNWVYKWYKPKHGSFTPDQIADHFVNLLETGYLKCNQQKTQFLLESEQQKKGKTVTKKEYYQRLRTQCIDMLNLIDKMEKSG